MTPLRLRFGAATVLTLLIGSLAWVDFGSDEPSQAQDNNGVQTEVQLIGAVPLVKGGVYRVDDEARGVTCYVVYSPYAAIDCL